MTKEIHAKTTIIRRKQVEALTGLSRSTIYHRISQGTFPSKISLGARAVGWVESEINEWLHHQIELSRKTTPPESLK